MSKYSISDGHVVFSSLLSLTILQLLRNSFLFQKKEGKGTQDCLFLIFGNKDGLLLSEQPWELRSITGGSSRAVLGGFKGHGLTEL